METVLAVTTGGVHATDISWVKARDSAKNPTMHMTAFHNKNNLAQNVDSAEVEKPCFK